MIQVVMKQACTWTEKLTNILRPSLLGTEQIRHRTGQIRHRTEQIRHRIGQIRHSTRQIRHHTGQIRHSTTNSSN